jgi:IS1 family transposase/transposase-like protein
MKIEITLHCPDCQSTNVKKNGKKSSRKQNYFCNNCRRQFFGDHALTYLGCRSDVYNRIIKALVRGVGIRDISEIEGVSTSKVLSVLTNSKHVIVPQKDYYDELEVDEFWTFVGKKTNKVWLVYAYHRESGEIVGFVWGKRNLKTARKLRQKLKDLKVKYGTIFSDNWNSFITAFKGDNHLTGKKHTVGIEGNNCRLRHRIRRAFRKTCCFSKKMINHLKAFNLAFYYINYGYV